MKKATLPVCRGAHQDTQLSIVGLRALYLSFSDKSSKQTFGLLVLGPGLKTTAIVKARPRPMWTWKQHRSSLKKKETTPIYDATKFEN